MKKLFTLVVAAAVAVVVVNKVRERKATKALWAEVTDAPR